MSHALVEGFFRREYARLVATLSRRVGVGSLQAAEDAAQAALLTALETWPVHGVPANPPAWLTRVASNELRTTTRNMVGRRQILRARPDAAPPERQDAVLRGEVQDDLLRMMFVCCDEAIPVTSQVALALKVLCGFDVREIAARLLTSEANVYKRLARARARLRESPPAASIGAPDRWVGRRPAVLQVIYQLFTEGYLSSHADQPIRAELCREALRLGHLLAAHRLGAGPDTHALMALMHLHVARLGGRVDGAGGLLLLEEQDRSTWDRTEIEAGLTWLARSASGDVFTRYHAEAAIAAEHCMAPSFADTRWRDVADLYALLAQATGSPVHDLNRAVAVAEADGPAAGLAVVEAMTTPGWLAASYQYAAVLADLHHRAGNHARGRAFRHAAVASAPSAAVRRLLERRLSGRASGRNPGTGE